MCSILLLSCCLLLLSLIYGCADSSTHGTEMEKEYDTRICINNATGGTINFSTPLTIDADSTSDTAQDTAGTSTISPQTRAQVTDGASTGSMANEGSSPILKDIINRDSTENTAPTTTTTTSNTQSTTPAVAEDSIETTGGEIDTGTPVIDTTGSGKKFNLSTTDGVKSLRTKEYGTSFGRSIRVVYQNGFTFTVPDTSKRFALNGRETVFRPGGPGLTPKNSELGTEHGGMGIWTQRAGSSTYLTIYTLIK